MYIGCLKQGKKVHKDLSSCLNKARRRKEGVLNEAQVIKKVNNAESKCLFKHMMCLFEHPGAGQNYNFVFCTIIGGKLSILGYITAIRPI